MGFASSLPMLAFSLLGGVIADRIDRRKLMLITQSAMMIFAFILWGLTALRWMSLPLLVLLSFATGIAMALNAPSYQALVPQLVPREDLANAIALNAAQFNLSLLWLDPGRLCHGVVRRAGQLSAQRPQLRRRAGGAGLHPLTAPAVRRR